MKSKMMTLAIAASLFTGCASGKFGLTKKVYGWNSTLSEPVQSLVMFGFMVVPVYPLVFTGDYLIFNTIEHWTGSNPVAFEEGHVEEQMVLVDGQEYQMVASKNQLKVKPVNSLLGAEEKTFDFNEETQVWDVY